MPARKLLETSWTEIKHYVCKSRERLILLQSTGLSSSAMLASYIYGKNGYTPAGTKCAPYNRFTGFDAGSCREIPAVIVYPEPWLSLMLAGVLGTLVIGICAATLDRSVFARYLLTGWLAYSAVIAISGYVTYSQIGQYPGAYFVFYPATTVVSSGVAVACAAALANIAFRMGLTVTRQPNAPE